MPLNIIVLETEFVMDLLDSSENIHTLTIVIFVLKQDKVLAVCQSGNMEKIEGNIAFQVPYHWETFL